MMDLVLHKQHSLVLCAVKDASLVKSVPHIYTK